MQKGSKPWVLFPQPTGPQPTFPTGPISHEAGPGGVKSFLLQSSAPLAPECPWLRLKLHRLLSPPDSPPPSQVPLPSHLNH